MLQQWEYSFFFPAGNWVQCNLVVGVVSMVGLPPARSGPGRGEFARAPSARVFPLCQLGVPASIAGNWLGT